MGLVCLSIPIQAVREDIGFTLLILGTMRTDMKASSEFAKFGKYFIQDIELMLLPGEEVFDFPLKIFKGNDRILLRNLLIGLFGNARMPN